MINVNVVGSVSSSSFGTSNENIKVSRNENLIISDNNFKDADLKDGVLDGLSQDLNDTIDNIFKLGSVNDIELPDYLSSSNYEDDLFNRHYDSMMDGRPNIGSSSPSSGGSSQSGDSHSSMVDSSNTPHDRVTVDSSKDNSIDRVSPDSVDSSEPSDVDRTPPPSSSDILDTSDSGRFDSEKQKFVDEVKNSSAYRNAYSVFSADPKYGTPFLKRLQSIPDSVNLGDKTIWDKLNISNNYDDIYRVAFNDVLISIQNLLSEYYSFVNSLPSTQVQQFWDAGINSAVTGHGVSGSSLSPTPQQNNSGLLQSTNSGQYIGSVANLLFNTIPSSVATLANSYASLKNASSSAKSADASQLSAYASLLGVQLNDKNTVAQIELAEKQSLAGLWNHLNDAGYSMEGVSFDSWDDVSTWQENLRFDTKAQSKDLSKYIESYYLDMTQKALASQRGGNNLADGFGMDLTEFYNDLGNHMIDEFVYTQRYNAAVAKYQYQYKSSLNPLQSSEAENYSNIFGVANHKFQLRLIDERLKFINKWSERTKTSNDPVIKNAFSNYIMGVSDSYLANIFGGYTQYLNSAARAASLGL